MKDNSMKDFISIDCHECGQSFKIDREEHAACGLEASHNPLSFNFAGHIKANSFSINISPKENLCYRCCIGIAQQAIVLWMGQEGLSASDICPQEEVDEGYGGQSQVDTVFYGLLSDSHEQRNIFVGVIVIQLILGFILGLAVILSRL